MTFNAEQRARERMQEQPGKANGAAPSLDMVWADDILLDIDKPGLVDGLLSTTAITVAYGESAAARPS